MEDEGDEGPRRCRRPPLAAERERTSERGLEAARVGYSGVAQGERHGRQGPLDFVIVMVLSSTTSKLPDLAFTRLASSIS